MAAFEMEGIETSTSYCNVSGAREYSLPSVGLTIAGTNEQQFVFILILLHSIRNHPCTQSSDLDLTK